MALRRPRAHVLFAIAAATAAVAGRSSWAHAQTIEQESDRIAGAPESSIATSLPGSLADPGGIRSRLGREGITFHVNYIGEVLGNPVGGVNQGTFYDGRLELAVEADFDKMIGWKGLSFFA